MTSEPVIQGGLAHTRRLSYLIASTRAEHQTQLHPAPVWRSALVLVLGLVTILPHVCIGSAAGLPVSMDVGNSKVHGELRIGHIVCTGIGLCTDIRARACVEYEGLAIAADGDTAKTRVFSRR